MCILRFIREDYIVEPKERKRLHNAGDGKGAPSFEEQKRIWDTLNLGLDSAFFNRILSKLPYIQLSWSLMLCAPYIIHQVYTQPE
ncbi:uncharacterized protein MJAP1_004083 [Malassezia japonica]|uniref:Uncharacterized protein n=1 Tax=Malassezia japonica TaxID=223818 RepID=A0AAF0F5C2_9BASI|nr:uncharacterized protein MJAP1_004083 [Malassezia japonica]WFD41090.1 hypothetical protein MJAP1_004083 [Malassezia japonica]